MKIKICGIKTEAEAQIINQTMPDFAGFVFAKSKRQVDFNTALKLKNLLNPKIKKVGVFVNSSQEEILNLRDLKIIDIAQLHGDYTEDTIKNLAKMGLSTIKVIPVKKNSYEIETAADFILFDYFSPNVRGGSNKSFDWNIKIKTNVPFFVAGGLNAQNIAEMAQKLNPYAADVSSGAEENGTKTFKKVSGIIKTVRGLIA